MGVHADCLGARTNGSRWAICYVPSAKENDLFRMNLWQQNRGELKHGVTSEGPEHIIKKVQCGSGAHTLKITVWIRTFTNVLRLAVERWADVVLNKNSRLLIAYFGHGVS